jgi:hypothetical protein
MKTKKNNNNKSNKSGNFKPKGKKGRPQNKQFKGKRGTVYTPPTISTECAHEELSPFPGIEVLVSLTTGQNIGFSEVEDRSPLQYGVVNADPGKEPIELFCKIDDESPSLQSGQVIVFTRGRDQEVTTHASNHRRGKSKYHQSVTISRSGNRVFVDYKTNNLYVGFVTSGGVIIKSVSLVNQDGQFYLLSQTQFSAEAFRDKEGGVHLPALHEEHGGLAGFATSDEVRDFYKSLSDEDVKQLRKVKKYERDELETDSLGDNEIVVKLWNLRAGNGVGIDKSGREVRLFWRDIQGVGPWALHTGQICTVRDITKIPSNSRAKTSLKWDARGIVAL